MKVVKCDNCNLLANQAILVEMSAWLTLQLGPVVLDLCSRSCAHEVLEKLAPEHDQWVTSVSELETQWNQNQSQ